MSNLPEIIGIAGTNGAGKDTLGDLRFEREGAKKVTLSDILRVEATKRGLSHERHNLSAISTEWGQKFGAGALSTMTLQEFYETRTETESGISIVSVRRPAEAQIIQRAGGTLFWVDAAREIRYERIFNANRGRPEDVKTFEKFCAEEDREMYPDSDDPSALNMAGVRDMSDMEIVNEFDSEAAYEAYLIERFKL